MNTALNIKSNTIENLSQDQFFKLEKLVAIDDLKDQYRTARKNANFDSNKQIETWLSDTVSKNTQRVYRNAIDLFRNYRNDKFLNFSVEEADVFIRHLKTTMNCGNTVKLYIAAVSSFYSHLTRYSWVSFNPFKGTKVVIDKSPLKEKVIPTQKDVEALHKVSLEMSSTSASLKMEISLRLMSEYGVRKGFLDNLSYSHGKLYSVSKGKEYIVILKDEDIEYFEQHSAVLSTLNSNTMSVNFNKAVKFLVESGIMRKGINCHSLRHKFAIEYYENSGKDIYRLMTKLNHSSITQTVNYLKGLKVL